MTRILSPAKIEFKQEQRFPTSRILKGTVIYKSDFTHGCDFVNIGQDADYGYVSRTTVFGVPCIMASDTGLGTFPEPRILLALPDDMRIGFEFYFGLAAEGYPSSSQGFEVIMERERPAENLRAWFRFSTDEWRYVTTAGAFVRFLDDCGLNEANRLARAGTTASWRRGVAWNYVRGVVDFDAKEYVSFQINNIFCDLADIPVYEQATNYDNQCLKLGYNYDKAGYTCPARDFIVTCGEP